MGRSEALVGAGVGEAMGNMGLLGMLFACFCLAFQIMTVGRSAAPPNSYQPSGGAQTVHSTERDSGKTSWVLFLGFQEKHLGSY